VSAWRTTDALETSLAKPAAPKLAASGAGDDEQPDGWQRHIEALRQAGIPEPGSAVRGRNRRRADEQALYEVAPSFVELLPWVEFLPESSPCCWRTANRWRPSSSWCRWAPRAGNRLAARPRRLENALQDSSMNWTRTRGCSSSMPRTNRARPVHADLRDYVQPRARGTAFTEFYLRFFGHHLRAVAKPGGLFEDTVTRLRWRGQTRRVRMVVYAARTGRAAARHPSRC
jgi:hypothetical protein